jgi:hypothetical protein
MIRKNICSASILLATRDLYATRGGQDAHTTIVHINKFSFLQMD